MSPMYALLMTIAAEGGADPSAPGPHLLCVCARCGESLAFQAVPQTVGGTLSWVGAGIGGLVLVPGVCALHVEEAAG